MKPFRIVILLFFASLRVFGDEGTEEINFRKVKFQELPSHIESVRVAPNGNRWFISKKGKRNLKLEQAKPLIESQFGKKNAIINGLRVVLLEPGGRCWFSDNYDSTLMGYDGKEWIVKVGKKANTFRGWGGPTRTNMRCIFFDGIPFFIGIGRVYWYSKGAFHEKVLVEGERHFGSFRFVPDPANKRLIACYEYHVASENHKQVRGFVQFRDGEWSTLELPAETSRSADIVFPLKGGLLCLGEEGYASFIADEKAPLDNLDKLIDQLGASSGKERREATKELKKAPLSALGTFKKRLATADDPEVLERLKSVIAHVENRGKAPPAIRLGDLELSGCLGKKLLNDHSLLVAFKSVRKDGEGLGKRALRLVTGGDTPQIFDPEVADTRWISGNYSPTLAVGKPTTGIWMGGGDRTMFLDLKTGRFTDKSPFGLSAVIGSDQEGHLFLTSQSRSGLTCLTPGLEDDRDVAKVIHTIPVKRPQVFADAHDTIWIDTQGGETYRITEGKLTKPEGLQGYAHLCTATLSPSEGINIDPFKNLPGHHGFYYLNKEGEVVKGKGSLPEFLVAHRKELKTLYGHRLVQAALMDDGRIWMLSHEKIHVYDGTWKVVSNELKNLKGKPYLPRVLLPAYNGNTVYVTDLDLLSSGGRPMFLSYDADRLVVKEAPCLAGRDLEFSPFWSPDGKTFWFPSKIRKSYGTGDSSPDVQYFKYDRDGNETVVKRRGNPVGIDATGTYWFVNRGGKLWIGQGGKPIKKGRVPISRWTQIQPIFLKSGKVMFWTGSNLLRMESQGPNAYDSDKATPFVIPDIIGSCTSMHYSGGSHLAIEFSSRSRDQEVKILSVDQFK